MSNVLRDQCHFFSIPAEFVESGGLRDLSPSAVKLYVALYFFAQKHSAVRLDFSNAQLKNHAGLDAKSVQAARTQLREQKLVRAEKGALGVYSYVLLNPTTCEPLPAPPGRTGHKRYHSTPRRHSEQPVPASEGAIAQATTPAYPTRPLEGRSSSGDASFRCFACKGTDCWTRGRDQVCTRCHPDPRSPVLRGGLCSPTATEVGF